jgi:cell division protein FtsQ
MVNTSARDDLRELGRQLRRGRSAPEDPLRPSRRLSRRARWIAAGIVVVLGLAAVWVIAFSPLLAVSTVKVTGTHRLSVSAVLDQAQVKKGTPLVRVPRGAIRERVEQLPDVLTASVSVSYPSTVVISVTERTASGVLQLAANSWGLVDDTGHQFTTVATRPVGLPVLAPAAAVSGDPATLAAMAQVAVATPAAVRAQLTQLTATGPGAVSLVLKDGRVVVWGASDRNAEKGRVLTALLAQPGHTFNVSDPDLPFTRPN